MELLRRYRTPDGFLEAATNAAARVCGAAASACCLLEFADGAPTETLTGPVCSLPPRPEMGDSSAPSSAPKFCNCCKSDAVSSTSSSS